MKPYYEHGGILIFHGDSREIVPQVEHSFLVTDPPYPNNAGHFTEHIEAARELLRGWLGITALVFWSELELPPVSLPLVGVHIWERPNVNGRPYEPIYHFSTEGDKRRSEVKSAAAVFDGAGPGCDQYLGHPTQKNEYIMSWLVGKIRPRVTITDPFMGVGTTLVSAKRLGHPAIGIDVNERYCEIAAKRLAQETINFPAELAEGGPGPAQLEIGQDTAETQSGREGK